ncbi:unnamed protein product [Ilex paraguariensis]|uniref:Uncharacterized protein n=1 Tax=Ilex paraguariensis TaxID=185542 RepID=A0ABC8S529_9AQUA
MTYFDLRYALPYVINILKSQVAMPWDWDSFDIMGHLTWVKFSFVFILFITFSSISIGLPLTCPVGYIRVQRQDFSAMFTVSFLVSLLCPQVLFWSIYPIILLLFACSSCLLNIFRSLLSCIREFLSTVPDLNIFITATNTDVANPEAQQVNQGDMGIDEADVEAQV